jgi:hypothetical protein
MVALMALSLLMVSPLAEQLDRMMLSLTTGLRTDQPYKPIQITLATG